MTFNFYDGHMIINEHKRNTFKCPLFSYGYVQQIFIQLYDENTVVAE